jgi:hypothetical protein
MARLKFKFDIKENKYVWTILETKNIGVLQFETNKGRILLSNYPSGQFPNLKRLDTLKLNHPLSAILWARNNNLSVVELGFSKRTSMLNIYNPAQKVWMACLQDKNENHIFDMLTAIEHDIVEYVSTHAPDINQCIAVYEEDRVSVEETFNTIENGFELEEVDKKEESQLEEIEVNDFEKGQVEETEKIGAVFNGVDEPFICPGRNHI